MTPSPLRTGSGEPIGLLLACEGLGDCLYAMAVLRKLHFFFDHRFDLFTRHPGLFRACPYVHSVQALEEKALASYPHQTVRMFELSKLPHGYMDTFDFISVPLGIGQLSYAEKQLEYFPSEPDTAEVFDVVLNTSVTWVSRTWPVQHWQRLADTLVARGLKVAVVGKDVASVADGIVKRSPPLAGALRNLVNELSLDQTYFTLRKARLFVSGQGGLTVLAGATDTEIIVLGTCIEWSKRAIYRGGSPFYRVSYVNGDCDVHCARPDCAVPGYNFKCIPGYDAVAAAVLSKLGIVADDRVEP